MLGWSAVLVFVAHLLAWAAFAFWAFGTTLLEEQDYPRVFWVLLFPVLVTIPAIAAVLLVHRWRTIRGVVLWGSALVLLTFSFLSGFSVGLYYMPAACVLIVAAGVDVNPQGNRG